MENDELTKVELLKEDVTFVWVRAEVINKNLKGDYDWIETYVDVPYSSEYFNSLKTEQKKAICQIRLLDKGIVTNYDSIIIGEKSDLNDTVDDFYDKIKGENDITPDSSVEEKAEAFLRKDDFKNAIALLEKENIQNTDIELKARVEYLKSLQEKYDEGQNEQKRFRGRTLEWILKDIEKHANIILKMNRKDVFYAEELLSLYKIYPNEQVIQIMVARALEVCKDGDAQFDGIKEQIKEIDGRMQKRKESILNGSFYDDQVENDKVPIPENNDEEYESGVIFGTDDDEDDDWFSNNDDENQIKDK